MNIPFYRHAEAKRGFTLLDLLVALAIISLLVALLLPAVQYARETSRRASCANNLHQIHLAMAAYESSFKCFPQSQNDTGSFLVAILPYSDQPVLYSKIKEFRAAGQTNANFNFVLPSYLCSSDPAVLQWGQNGISGANYCGNSGSWAREVRKIDGIFRSFSDIGFGSGIVRVSDVTDGLSNTDMVSEQLRSDGTRSRLRTVWNTVVKYNDRKLFARDCHAIPPDPTSAGWMGNETVKGTPWIDGNIMVTLFNHVCIPNSPSCFNRNTVPTGAASVASFHKDSVNVLFADGHLVTTSESIDDVVWFEQGSRDGGIFSSSVP